MRFVLQKCRKIIYLAMLFAGISMIGIPNANAIVIGGLNVGILCGPVQTTPIPIFVGTGYRFITTSMTVSVLKAGTADRKIVRHFVVVKSILPNGSVAWTNTFQVQSLAIAAVDLEDTPPSYSFPDTLDLSNRNGVPISLLSTDCLSLYVANSGSQNYLAVVMGTSSTLGGDVVTTKDEPGNPVLMASGNTLEAVQGQDKSIINISVLNLNNGNAVRTFKPRSGPNRYFLLQSSGIFDIDNDLNDELVLAYVRFIGDIRYDFTFEHYNIATGALERTTTMTQFNQVKFQK